MYFLPDYNDPDLYNRLTMLGSCKTPTKLVGVVVVGEDNLVGMLKLKSLC